MTPHPKTRRRFIAQSVSSASALSLLNFSWVLRLPKVSAEELTPFQGNQMKAKTVDRLVRLMESTDRNELIEVVAGEILAGASYRDLLAALMLAAVRNVQPQPSVGFKFHAVLVIHSAHLATVSGPDTDRWLPFFWALDYFKSRQEEERRVSGWQMKPLPESKIPSATRAKALFEQAMDRWDVEAAELAAAGMARGLGGNEVFEVLFRYAARDYRSIGHKVIFVANSWRTLQLIGWRHAEPVLRSLTLALLNHQGDPNPSSNDLNVDRPWKENQPKAAGLRRDWLDGKTDKCASASLIEAIREADPSTAADAAAELIQSGQSAQAVWDAVYMSAGELVMQQPGRIIGLHSLTTTNAMRQAYLHSGDDEIRRRLTLQACSFIPFFRQTAAGRGAVRNRPYTELTPESGRGSADDASLKEILRNISRDKDQAANQALGWIAGGGAAETIIDAARQLVFVKGNDAHDYKYSSAVLEDYYQVSPAWRNQFLALSMYDLIGLEDRDNSIVQRIRQALNG